MTIGVTSKVWRRETKKNGIVFDVAFFINGGTPIYEVAKDPRSGEYLRAEKDIKQFRKRREVEIENDLEIGISRTGETVSQRINEYMEERTAAKYYYMSTFVAFWKEHLGDVALADLTHEKISDIVKGVLKKQTRNRTDRSRPKQKVIVSYKNEKYPRTVMRHPSIQVPITASARNRYVEFLRHVLNARKFKSKHVIDWRVKAGGGDALRASEERKKAVPLKDAEVDQFFLWLAAQPEHADTYPVFEMLLVSGARFTSVVTMPLKAFDDGVETGFITVKGKSRYEHAKYLVQISSAVLGIANECAAVARRAGLKTLFSFVPVRDARVRIKGGVRVYQAGVVAAITPTKVLSAWQDGLDALDWHGKRIHDWRHTFAFRILRSGRTLKELQVLLNHKDLKTTSEIYGHLSNDQVREAADTAVRQQRRPRLAVVAS